MMHVDAAAAASAADGLSVNECARRVRSQYAKEKSSATMHAYCMRRRAAVFVYTRAPVRLLMMYTPRRRPARSQRCSAT